MRFTNLSAHACTLLGYPGVAGVDLAGRQLGSAASRNPAHASASVTLAAGATAHAVLRITDTGNYGPSLCAPVTAAGLRGSGCERSCSGAEDRRPEVELLSVPGEVERVRVPPQQELARGS